MSDTDEYRLVEADGVTAAIVHGGKILLVKRVNFPLISNPGIWVFVQGSRKKGEEHIETAYREIHEEVAIGREHLELVFEKKDVVLFDAVKKKHKWKNAFFIFQSKTQNVKTNYESQGHRWAHLEELVGEKEYTNIFIDKEEMLDHIRRALHGKYDKK
ncbi:MAG: NUDIX domain-containing protein [Candidatus Micrarchaeota archaeon]|nr:NUDIX domain-containing protein [Candidatus Micrarchaeota archaeon]